jgi:hypothetical protein
MRLGAVAVTVGGKDSGTAISHGRDTRRNEEPAASACCRSFIPIEKLSRLAPDRPPEIDLAGARERAGASTNSAADQRAFERGTHESATDGTDTGTDSTAGESAIARGIAAAGKNEKRQGDCYDYPFHDPSPCRGLRIIGHRQRPLVCRREYDRDEAHFGSAAVRFGSMQLLRPDLPASCAARYIARQPPGW